MVKFGLIAAALESGNDIHDCDTIFSLLNPLTLNSSGFLDVVNESLKDKLDWLASHWPYRPNRTAPTLWLSIELPLNS